MCRMHRKPLQRPCPHGKRSLLLCSRRCSSPAPAKVRAGAPGLLVLLGLRLNPPPALPRAPGRALMRGMRPPHAEGTPSAAA